MSMVGPFACTGLYWEPASRGRSVDGFKVARAGWSAPLGCDIYFLSKDDAVLEVRRAGAIVTVTLARRGSAKPLLHFDVHRDAVRCEPYLE